MNFWDFFWLMIWGFFFTAYLMVLLQVIVDVFRDRSLNGWARTGWIIALLFAAPLTALVYLIVRGRSMNERSMRIASESRAAADQHAREVGFDPAESIAKAQGLLDSGAITPAEFDRIKGKALA